MKKKFLLICLTAFIMASFCGCTINGLNLFQPADLPITLDVISINPDLKTGCHVVENNGIVYFFDTDGLYAMDEDENEQLIYKTNNIEAITVAGGNILFYDGETVSLVNANGELLDQTDILYDFQYMLADENGLYVVANTSSLNYFEEYSDYLSGCLYYKDFKLKEAQAFSLDTEVLNNPYIYMNVGAYYQENEAESLYSFIYTYNDDDVAKQYHFIDMETKSQPYMNALYYLDGPVARTDNKTFIFNYHYYSNEYDIYSGFGDRVSVALSPAKNLAADYEQEIFVKGNDNNIEEVIALAGEYVYTDAYVQDHVLYLFGVDYRHDNSDEYNLEEDHSYYGSALYAIDLETNEMEQVYVTDNESRIVAYRDNHVYYMLEGSLYKKSCAAENASAEYVDIISAVTTSQSKLTLEFTLETHGDYLYVYKNDAYYKRVRLNS